MLSTSSIQASKPCSTGRKATGTQELAVTKMGMGPIERLAHVTHPWPSACPAPYAFWATAYASTSATLSYNNQTVHAHSQHHLRRSGTTPKGTPPMSPMLIATFSLHLLAGWVVCLAPLGRPLFTFSFKAPPRILPRWVVFSRLLGRILSAHLASLPWPAFPRCLHFPSRRRLAYYTAGSFSLARSSTCL